MLKTRKPNSILPSFNPKRPAANDVLNKFLSENKIALALGNFKVQYTDMGAMIVDKPVIVAIYKDEVDKVGGKLGN